MSFSLAFSGPVLLGNFLPRTQLPSLALPALHSSKSWRTFLSRTKFAARIALSPLPVDRLVEKCMQSATLVIPHQLAGIAPDPDDDVGIGTALAANADLIVTGDHGLLSVGRYRHVRIVSVT